MQLNMNPSLKYHSNALATYALQLRVTKRRLNDELHYNQTLVMTQHSKNGGVVRSPVI